MNIFQSYTKINLNSHAVLLISLLLGFLYVCCHAFVQKFNDHFPVICLYRRFLNVYCPFCGISRSCACFLKFEFQQSLIYNPLIVFLIPFFLVIGLNSILTLSGAKFFVTIPNLLKDLFVYSFLTCVFIIGIVRIVTFVYPPINPAGFLVPPP
jgi:hypothetical protein